MRKKGFLAVLLLVSVLLLSNSLPVGAAVAPPISSGCRWTVDYYSCGSGSSSYTCSNGVSSSTGKCDDACGASLSCDGLSPLQFYGCNTATKQQRVCDANCQITDGKCDDACGASLSCDGLSPLQFYGCNMDTRQMQICDANCQIANDVCSYTRCAAHANCDGKAPGSYVAGNLCSSSGRPYLCSSKCWQTLSDTCSSSCYGTSASCSGYAPGKTFCQANTNKQQTCNDNCGLDTATSCAKNVCGAECSTGDTTKAGCPSGEQKTCDVANCKWSRCTGLAEPPCADADGDKYYSNAVACGKTAAEQDCNDANAAINPGAAEVCGNSIDDDCAGGDAACPAPASCGNGKIDAGEDCDGSSLNSQTCVSKGFSGGALSCYAAGTASQCKYNTGSCTTTTPVTTPPVTGPQCSGVCAAEGGCPAGYSSTFIGLSPCSSTQVCCVRSAPAAHVPVPVRPSGVCDGVDPDRKKECCLAVSAAASYGWVWGRSGEAAAEPASGSKDVFYAWVQDGELKVAVSDLKLNGWGAATVAGSSSDFFNKVQAVRQLVVGDVVYLAWVQDSNSGTVDFDGEPFPAYEVWAQSFSREGKALGAAKKLAGGGTGFRSSPQIFYDYDSGSVVYNWVEGGSKVVSSSGSSVSPAGFSAHSVGSDAYGGKAYYAWLEMDVLARGTFNVKKVFGGVAPVGGGSLAVSELGKGSFFLAPLGWGWVAGVPSVQVAGGRVYYAWPVKYVDYDLGHFGVFSYDVRLASANLDGSGLKVENVGLGIRSSAGFARVIFKVAGDKIYFALEPSYSYGKSVSVWVGAADSTSLKKVDGFSPFFVSLGNDYFPGANGVVVDAYGGKVYLWYVGGEVYDRSRGTYSWYLNLYVLDGSSGSLADKVERRDVFGSQLQLQIAPDSTAAGRTAAVDTQFFSDYSDRKAPRGTRLLPNEELCIGDDSPELFPLRSKQCLGVWCGNYGGDSAICDKSSDCVFNGKCFSDIDTVAATFFGGNKSAAWASSWKGEVSADVNGDGRLEVCDPGQWMGVVGSVAGFVTDASSGSGLGSALVSAVGTSDRQLQYSATTAADGAYTVSNVVPANYDITASKGGYTSSTRNNMPVLPFQTVNADFALSVSSAVVSGFVRNASRENSEGPCPAQGCPVGGAVVKVLGTAGLFAVSGSDGSYSVADVPVGTYDIVAGKAQDGYEDASVLGKEVAGGVVFADFVLVKALGQCEDDCTKVGSNLCDAGCHGKGLCWFNSDETKQACDNTFGLVEMPDGQYVDCCRGKAYAPIKADVSVPSENVVVTRKPVLYKGRFATMVMVVFSR